LFTRRCIGLATFALALLVTLSSTAFALSFSWAPHELDFVVAPGASKTQEFRVTNHSGAAVNMKIEYQDWSFQGADHQFLPPGSQPNSALTWLSVQPEQFRIEAGGTQKVRVLASVPQGASGAKFAAIFASTVASAQDTEGSKVLVGTRLGVLVPVRVEGTGVEQVEVVDIGLKREDDTEHVVLSIKNTGDVHVRPQFRMVLTQSGQVATTLKSTSVTRLLPGQTRQLKAALPIDLEPGIYQTVGAITWQTGGRSGQHPFTKSMTVER
jgi:P pilus assembly chaperone PapD